jgi:amidase
VTGAGGDGDLLRRSAVALAGLLRRKELSAVELMEATLRRIEQVNPAVNAVVTLLPQRALAGARAADEALARGEPPGPLHGLPVAHKETNPTAGIRTTWGSPIYTDHVPAESALIVERLQAGGAITIGKTNAPEFGAGSHTFNPVFGTTRNPYDPAVSAGGSSGGAAVALACGMHALADGSDLGGSLRNPAGWNNVVGFRPSPGRVPVWPDPGAWFTMAVHGPLGRTVEDVALMLSAVAGPDRRSPVSLELPGSLFAGSLAREMRGLRVAFAPDLGGLPVDPRVAEVVAAQRQVFVDLGCDVADDCPDLSEADLAFHAYRAWDFEAGLGELLDRHPDQLKQTVIWNIEEGRTLSGPDLGRAERARTRVYEHARRFFERYDVLVGPVSQVPPFPVEVEYPTEVAGVPMDSYIAWMKSCSRITVTESPAVSVPAGFTRDGHPTGLQIVGPHHADRLVLEVAWAFQEATGHWRRPPAVLAG